MMFNANDLAANTKDAYSFPRCRRRVGQRGNYWAEAGRSA